MNSWYNFCAHCNCCLDISLLTHFPLLTYFPSFRAVLRKMNLFCYNAFSNVLTLTERTPESIWPRSNILVVITVFEVNLHSTTKRKQFQTIYQNYRNFNTSKMSDLKSSPTTRRAGSKRLDKCTQSVHSCRRLAQDKRILTNIAGSALTHVHNCMM